jgi:hypothetical protein
MWQPCGLICECEIEHLMYQELMPLKAVVGRKDQGTAHTVTLEDYRCVPCSYAGRFRW